MENLGVLVGVAAAVAVAAYFRDRAASLRQRIIQAIAAALIAGAVAAGIRYVVDSLHAPSPEKIVDRIRSAPLTGIVLRDFPEAEAKMRAAIERDRRSRPAPGRPSQTFLAGMELRETYIVPALLGASDESLVAVSIARLELIHHLQATDLPACRAFTLLGIERPDLLAPEARARFARVMQATEAAYVSGRAGGRQVPKQISHERAGELLALAGWTPADFERLERITTLNDAEVCRVGVRLDQATLTLLPPHRAALSRYLVAR